jgi:hypothetical protein
MDKLYKLGFKFYYNVNIRNMPTICNLLVLGVSV